MTEKELTQLHYLGLEIKSLQEDLCVLKNSDLYKSPEITDLPKNQIFDDKIASHVAKLVDIQNLIQEKIELLCKQRREVEYYIDSIEDDEVRLIIRLRFIRGLTWEEIGGELHRSKTGVIKKYKRYIEKCHQIHQASVI